MPLRFSGLAGLGAIPDPGVDDFARASIAAFDRKDDALALEQIAAALSFAPLRPDLLHLLERLLDRHPSPRRAYEALVAQRPFFGFHAAAAWADAREGDLGAALEKILQVATYRPDIPYLRWAERWIDSANGTRGVSLADVLPHLSRLAAETSRHPAERVRATLEAGTRLAHRLGVDRPRSAASLALVEAHLLRQMGFADQAVSVIESVDDGSFELCVELACAHRALGRWEQAVACYERAARSRSGDAATRIDLGDARLECGDLLGARRDYDDALAIPSDAALQLHATVARDYVSVVLDGDAAALATLASNVERSPLARRLHSDVEAYRSWLPPLRDPLARAITHFVERARAGGSARRLRVTLDAPPSPWARWAVDAAAKALGRDLRLIVVVGDREIVDDQARPTLERSVDDLLGALASSFDVDLWLASARALEVEQAVALLAAGAPPASARPLHDLTMLRIAVLARLARSSADDELAFRALAAEAADPDGWRAAAAVVVLGAVARARGARAEEAARLVMARTEGANDLDDASLHPALVVARGLPTVSRERRAELFARQRRMERSD